MAIFGFPLKILRISLLDCINWDNKPTHVYNMCQIGGDKILVIKDKWTALLMNISVAQKKHQHQLGSDVGVEKHTMRKLHNANLSMFFYILKN